ncbi:MAG: hypothetical protein ABIK09_06945 [Pseudomonadota bacterium]
MSEGRPTAAAVLSAVLAGASPTVGGTMGQLDHGVDVRPSAMQVALEPTVSCVESAGISLENLVREPLPHGSLEGTYGQAAVFPRVPSSRTRQLVMEQLAARVDALYAEHSELVDHNFSRGLSATEKRRLEFVRWNLHQIQDAKQGEQLDALGNRAREYAAFAAQVAQLKAEILDKLPKRSGR